MFRVKGFGMVVVIYILAGLLFALGLGLVVSSVNLLPTDLGLVYLQGGITFITGAAIILAIAFSTRQNRFRRLGRHELKRSPPLEEDDASAAPAGLSPPGESGFTIASAAPLLGEKTSGHVVVDDPRTQAVLDAFERDLGAELARAPIEPAQQEEGMPVSPPSSEPRLTAQEAVPASFSPPFSPSSPISLSPPSLTEEEKEPLMFDLPPLPPMIQQAGWKPSPPDPGYFQNRPVPDVAGLLPDDDLASLAEAGDPLPPLETLEEVGSYESAGTRFTMYSDGSVVTSNTKGNNRYRTLDDLRAVLAAQGGKA